MGSYRWRSAIMLGCLIVAGVLEGVGIAAILPLLNLVVGKHSLEGVPLGEFTGRALLFFGLEPTLGTLLVVIVVIVGIKGVFTFLAMKQVGYTVAYVVTDLRLSLVRALLKARWDYLMRQPIGLFTNAISTEAMRLSKGYQLACAIIAGLIQVTFYLIIAFLISWKVTVISFLIGIFITGLMAPLVRIARKAGASQTKVFQTLMVKLTELLTGMKPIKAMGAENKLGPFLEKESENLKKALQSQVMSSEMLKTFQEPLIVFFMAIGIYLIFAVWAEPVTSLLVMAFIFYRTASRIGRLQKQFQALAVSETAYWSFLDRLREVESAEETFSGDGGIPFDKDVRIQNVTFKYEGQDILKDISITLPYGKLTVLIGLSGEGKTTLADLLAGLVRPDEGDIFVDGLPLGKIDLEKWRKNIGYVPQEILLFNDSIHANVTFTDPDISRDDVENALRDAGAWDFVSKLPKGLDAVVGEHGGQISGGQRQRIALARALIRKPKILILDEVTTALDPKTEADICHTLLRLRNQMTILAISHKQALIDAADLVYQIKEGEIKKVHFDRMNRNDMI
ncbi:MAG: ABC transporter ATP-binding protein [Deltaproteobacteria bacterium]|nr:ABC transporter ATP-binding protein [Deltaproteobacteria bacterium]